MGTDKLEELLRTKEQIYWEKEHIMIEMNKERE